MSVIQQFLEYYRRYTVRFWLYIIMSLGFIVFFTVILLNENSRYSIRLQQSQTRISTRMQMMRDDYLRADSVFHHEADSLARIDSLQSAK